MLQELLRKPLHLISIGECRRGVCLLHITRRQSNTSVKTTSISLQSKSGSTSPAEDKNSSRLPQFRECDVVACLEAFLSQGMVQRADRMFKSYQKLGHTFSNDVCNLMLMGWAKKGKWLQTKNLLKRLEQQGFVPDSQTYAILLFLFSKQNNKKEAQEVLEEMNQKGITVSDLFYKTRLTGNQILKLQKILKACLGSDYEQLLQTPAMSAMRYPAVIEEWYTKRTSHGIFQQKTPSQSLLGGDALKQRLQRQMKIEKDVSFVGYTSLVPSTRSVEARARINMATLLITQISKGGLVIETLAQSLDVRRKGDITSLKSKWKSMLTEAVGEMISEYSTIGAATRGRGRPDHYTKRFYPFLTLLQPSEWVDILVDEIAMDIVTQSNGLPINVLCRRLCSSMWLKKTMKQLHASGIPNKVSSMYEEYTNFLCSSEANVKPAREFWEELHMKHIMSGTLKPNHSRMPMAIVLQVGGALLDVLLKAVTFQADANDPESKPIRAFYHVYEFLGERKVGYIKAHPHILNILKGTVYKIKIESDKVPMLVPPRPWVSSADGGYLLLPTSLVRTPPESYHNKLLSTDSCNLSAVCDAVNYVSQCSWRINSKILNLIVGLFRENGNEDLSVPISEFPQLPEIPKNASSEDRRLIIKKRKEVKKLTRELHSLRMDMLYRLSLAKYFEKEVFWLPHNLDFRGRTYPIPPHLSHMSNDTARGILMFDEGRPLGKDGLKWLKIHLVNLHGVKKKASLEERAAYVDEIMPLVMDSADDPMNGEKWWQDADNPWQALAVCMEIADAVRSGNPENYVSHIPVHQDGSCNGLQHYAALGRDVAGAEQVNLLPSDKPEDLYHAVAMMVEQKRRKDAENGLQVAKDLEGKIHRKVVKQTVMTVVYGVTMYGGRLQVERQLDGDVSDEIIIGSSKYIVNLIFEALRDMFSSARELQDWLTNSARQISRAGCLTEWVTPLGFPVVQPYTVKQKIAVKTPLQTLSSYLLHSTELPSKTKQKNGFPPNFIHSLDSTHMMLTALHCQRAGVTFVAVHDSFWTHACTVDAMNRICREQFVALHNQPIIEDLSQSFEKKFGGLRYKTPKEEKTCSFQSLLPSKGDLDISKVIHSQYFFS